MNNDNFNNSRRTIRSASRLAFFDFANPQSTANLVKYGDGCIKTVSPNPSITIGQVWGHKPFFQVLPKLYDKEVIELETGFARIFGGGNVR